MEQYGDGYDGYDEYRNFSRRPHGVGGYMGWDQRPQGEPAGGGGQPGFAHVLPEGYSYLEYQRNYQERGGGADREYWDYDQRDDDVDDEWGGPSRRGRAKRTGLGSSATSTAGRGKGSAYGGSLAAGKKKMSAADAFRKFDKNASGYLDYKELRPALKHYGIDVSLKGAAEVVAAYDDYPDGKLELGEFSELVRDIERGLTGSSSKAASRLSSARAYSASNLHADERGRRDEEYREGTRGGSAGHKYATLEDGRHLGPFGPGRSIHTARFGGSPQLDPPYISMAAVVSPSKYAMLSAPSGRYSSQFGHTFTEGWSVY